jgi:uncharacterized protein
MEEMGPVQLRTRLMLHIYSGQGNEIEEIIGEHPDAVLWTDVGGGTMLHEAVAHGSAKMDLVRLLLDRGSDVNWADKDGLTPLMFAAMHGEIPVMRLLLEKGADDEMRDNRGRIAAEVAHDCDRPEAALELATRIQNRHDTAERQRQQALDAEAAQAHNGLDHKLVVKKPLVMRR